MTNAAKLLFLLIFLFLSASVTPAYAIETGTLGAYPTNYDPTNALTKSWFIYAIAPGQTKQDKITVANYTDNSIRVLIYPVDATTTKDGAFALYNQNDPRRDIGNWVKLAQSDITVAPKEHKDIPFTITIPQVVSVGDHAGGIIVQQEKVNKVIKEGVGINIISRIGVRMYETVPGERMISFLVHDFRQTSMNNRISFILGMENNGNVFTTPKGSIEITDIFGKKVDSIQLDTLGTPVLKKPITQTIESHLTKPLLAKYTAVLTLVYAPNKSITRTITFMVYDQIKLFVIALVAIIMLVVIVRAFLFFSKNKITISKKGE